MGAGLAGTDDRGAAHLGHFASPPFSSMAQDGQLSLVAGSFSEGISFLSRSPDGFPPDFRSRTFLCRALWSSVPQTAHFGEPFFDLLPQSGHVMSSSGKLQTPRRGDIEADTAIVASHASPRNLCRKLLFLPHIYN
jgi:hypothetical protein